MTQFKRLPQGQKQMIWTKIKAIQIALAETAFQFRGKSILMGYLAVSRNQVSDGRRSFGENITENTSESRRLLIRTMMDVIQSLAMAKNQFDHLRYSKLTKYLHVRAFSIQVK